MLVWRAGLIEKFNTDVDVLFVPVILDILTSL